ncbi:acyl--CoA ligase [Cnuibacter physcomitrellae]|uniref:class I adenylate-forming enzyme family protein n=1 Tax=Cnuibacter physcomitrellae TaxID=1619308 RepID=UPI0021756E38|nr:class I adenylate-forming enzyme family protein [Cnuibacter physcomitrellae]MCS5498320.1 acyl--CoA ligase [Cnuibacter physcomitrellae]
MTTTITPRPAMEQWGDAIQVERVRGIEFRTYSERPRNVAHLLSAAARWGDRPHLVQGDRTVTFEDLTRAVAGKARVLASEGIGPGDRVMLIGFNSPEWIVNFWAILVLGAVPVLGNAWWGPADVEDAIGSMDLRSVLADSRASRSLPAETSAATWELVESEQDTAIPYADAGDEDAPAVIVFTSGTSGRPKAVVLSHRSLLAGLQMLLDVTRRLPQMVGESTGDASLHTGPMFHIGGVQTLIRAIMVGDTLVMPRGRFDAGEAIELIERWRIARWSAVPTMLSRVLEHPAVHDHDLTSLRSLTAGGAPVHAEFVAAIRSGLPGVTPRVATGYGLTENGGQATAASGRDTGERPGSCGRPLPCVDVSIADPEDGVGEILLRSPTQMIGYFGGEESPIDADGWLHTGDLGRLDADGYLWITGRLKDMIIRGGENIAPAAVEEALGRVPGVVESTVFGVPHPDLGEEVMAVVCVTRDVSEPDLTAALKATLPSFAVPSRWRLQAEPLQTNHSGKIDKKEIAAQEIASLGAPSKGVGR